MRRGFTPAAPTRSIRPMTTHTDRTVLRGQQLLNALADAGLDDWQGLPGCIRARFGTGGFTSGLALANRIGEAAEAANHHPDLALSYPHLDVRLTSHDVGGVTNRDLRLAVEVSALAQTAGASPEPDAPVLLELGLDTAQREVIAPFWAALLTGDATAASGDEIIDPSGQLPPLWFQDCEEHEVPHQRLHVDLSVPEALAPARIRAVVAAGGTVVDDSRAPMFTVLEDADGNRACVCTLAQR